MNHRYLLLPCLFLALALAACGSGDEPENPKAERAQIRRAIEEAMTSTDLSACTKFETQAYMEFESGETGHPAVAACEMERMEEQVATSATISDVKVEGEEASAAVAITASALEGQTLRYALVKEDDRWKLDRLTGFVKMDRDRLDKTVIASLSSAGIPMAPSAVVCIARSVRAAPQPELEQYVLRLDPSAPSTLDTQIKNCVA